MPENVELGLTVRVGCHMVYETKARTPALFLIKPRRNEQQRVDQERLHFRPGLPATEFQDVHGNIVHRAILQPGDNVIHHDALVSVKSEFDYLTGPGEPVPLSLLPPAFLRYTLPSRYCDSDKLMNFAWQQFGTTRHGVERVRAICDWVHHNIEYRFGAGRPDISASEILAQRFGVCRDYAHVAISLCRAFNLPTRYVTGHLPDIGYKDPGTPMDFHAYFEVYLDHKWLTFDARYNIPRLGRIKVAHGLDAVDGAITTIYGEAPLKWFEVWAYQVNPEQVSVGDPVDLSKRLDGTETVRYS